MARKLSSHIGFYGAMLLMALYNVPCSAGDNNGELPVPRFASLRSDDVNMRIGPGSRYNINWVYKHEGLPVEIIREFEEWRQVRDSDGTVGWVHKQMLQGKRTAIIKKNIGVLRRAPDEHSAPVIRAEPGVTGKLLECDLGWCKMQIAGHKGWIQKASIWGVYKNEKF